jgi:sigma-B regulation protein RsbU (phosphoserine phosphatase)
MAFDRFTMDTVRFAAGVLVTACGLLSGVLFVVRIRRRDNTLLYFALGATMYGVRLLLEAAHQSGSAAVLFITLVIPVPLVLFMAEVVAPGWRKVAWAIVAADLAVAVVGLGAPLLGYKPAVGTAVNSIVVLLSIPVFVAMTFFSGRPADRDLHVLRTGLTIFLLFVVYTNLVGLGLIAGKGNLEFIGFTVNLCCLGYVALARAQRNEESLLSLQKELEIARAIQGQLLPQPTSEVSGLVIASRYVPASSVAGDFYDLLPNDGALGILIADVSGHGIPAALSASMVKVAVRSQMERAGDPAEVLRGMNSILCGNLQGQFVSAGYLFLNPAQGMLTYAGAGHPPLLIWRSEARRVESVEENGLLLGIFPESSYTARRAPLGRGDRCLLYTDGLLEAPGPSGEEFGPHRLRDFLAAYASLPAQGLCDALMRELTQWGKQSGKQQQQDDVTVVAIDFP